MGFSGVIFDFNGTLFWDTELHNEAWNIFIAENRLKKLSDAEKNLKMHGKTNQEILPMLFGKELTPEEVRVFIQRKETIYQELCLKLKMDLAPGVVPLLDFLKLRNIAFTIATSSGIGNLRFYFEHLNLEKWFDFDKVVYNDGTMKSKPDPEIFLTAMAKIQKAPREVIVFEDSLAGIAAAERAKPGKIIIVASTNEDYGRWDYPVIKSFATVDREMFL